MTMTMKTTMKTTAAAVSLTLLGALPLSGQRGMAGGQACEAGVITGTLGISGLDCVGECTVTLDRDGREENWVFSTEPRIFSVEGGGPADGILKSGDYLVAIGGALITTREGGRKYADLSPGEIVTLRYRRDGDVHEAGIRVGSQCRPAPEPTRAIGRVAPPSPPSRPDAPDRPLPPTGIASAPRIRVNEAREAYASALATPSTETGLLWKLGSTPRGRLGIGLGCSECGTRTIEEMGQEIWFFSGPIEVTQVTSGGPAEEAGIRMGDLITAIDGHDVTTEAGGIAFSTLTPGEAVSIRVVRRTGREETVTLVPSGPEAGYLTGRLAPRRAPDEVEPPRSLGVPVAPPSQPTEPARGNVPRLASGIAGPENLPVSYSGTVEGVEVLVRGGPVTVVESTGPRTLIINADGLWIRIRVPAGSTGTGVGGSEVR